MSNNKQQTAVEWLWEIAYNRELTVEDWKQAKAMRKEEIKNAQMDMFIHLNNLHYGLEYLKKRQSAEDFAEQYYNETFGDNNDENDI
jgi:hypothetical protein